MGTCYSANVKLKFKEEDSQKILAKMEECYQNHLSQRVNFGIELYPFKSPSSIEDYMALYFVSHQRMYDLEKRRWKNGKVTYSVKTGFDASYGWECVMLDLFEGLAEYLERGSVLDMWPDNYHETYRIKDGKVY